MKIAVAMSGGVDSSMSAVFLQNQGESVLGVTLALWRGSLCCSLQDAGEARAIARQLKIPHYLIDGIDAFREKIVQPFIAQRLAGRTPNPCVDCNPRFKVDFLLEKLWKRTAADYLATGHYVQNHYNPQTQRYELWRGKDVKKDQSYMLWQLSQAQLARLRFPLGGFSKKEVRQQAADLGWQAWAQKPDSQDLCFLTPSPAQFWHAYAPEGCLPGPIQDKKGLFLGEHKGRIFYTHGQRKGLNISAQERLYVTDIQPRTNTLVVGPHPETLCHTLTLDEIHWVSVAPWDMQPDIFVKTHYQSPLVQGHLIQTGKRQAKLCFETAISNPGSGQSCVFYDAQGRVLGGGKVCQKSP